MPSILEVLSQRAAPAPRSGGSRPKPARSAVDSSAAAAEARAALAESRAAKSKSTTSTKSSEAGAASAPKPSPFSKTVALAKKTSKKGPLEVLTSRKAYDVSGLALKRKKSGQEESSQSKNAIGDPRFSDLCGSLDVHAVGRNYAFLEDYREKERIDLVRKRSELLKAKSKNCAKRGVKPRSAAADEITQELKTLEATEKRRQGLAETADMKRKLVTAQREAILKSGGTKKVYHFSEAKVRREVRKEQDGKMGAKALEKRDAKRERRTAAKEKKGMVKRT